MMEPVQLNNAADYEALLLHPEYQADMAQKLLVRQQLKAIAELEKTYGVSIFQVIDAWKDCKCSY